MNEFNFNEFLEYIKEFPSKTKQSTPELKQGCLVQIIGIGQSQSFWTKTLSEALKELPKRTIASSCTAIIITRPRTGQI